MKRSLQLELAGLALTIAVLGLLFYLDAKGVPQYRIGMTWEQVRELAPSNAALERLGIVVDEDVTEQMKRIKVFYILEDQTAGIEVKLNYYKEVVAIRRYRRYGVNWDWVRERL